MAKISALVCGVRGFKQILSLGLGVACQSLWAMPEHCGVVTLEQPLLSVKADAPVTVIHNHTDLTVYLSYNNTTGEAHAGYSTKLDPHRYAVLNQNKKHLSFFCIEEGHGSAQRVHCEQVINVCQMEKGYTLSGNQRGVWLQENEPLDTLQKVTKAVAKKEPPASK